MAKFKFEDFDKIEEPAEPDYLVQRLIETCTFVVVWGAPGSGKTYLAIEIGISVASAGLFGGNQAKQGTVVYIVAEGRRGFARRLRRIREALDLGAIPFKVLRAAPDFGSGDNDVDQLLKDLAEAGIEPDLVIIDTLSRTFGNGNDDSSSRDMARFVSNISRLQEALQATVLIIHHSGKDESRGMRGSNVLDGAADTVLKVVEETTGGGCVIVDKQRDGAKGARCLFTVNDAGLLEMGCWDEAGGRGKSRKKKMGGEATQVLNAIALGANTDAAINDHIASMGKDRNHARNIKHRGLKELLDAGKLVRVGEAYEVAA